MKSFKRILILLPLILLFLTGCKSRLQTIDLAICGSYGVPGMFCYELKGGTNECEVLETDSQGRILFSYTTDSVITGEDETAIVICQAIDSKNVYFYEDQCYLLGEWEDSDVELLKEQNDWECELDYSKMAKRSNKISFDLHIITDNELVHKEVKNACIAELCIDESQVKELCILDKNPSGSCLFWLVVENEGIAEKYYVLVNADYEVALMEGSDEHAAPSAIALFKQNNGWDYGFDD